MHLLKNVEAPQIRTDIPDFNAGDTIRVQVKVVEGEKERLQAFQGVVISRRGAGIRASFTVRKISDGVGVERIFPLHSPILAKIEVIQRGRVRRSKIYYLTKLKGKSARIREKRAPLESKKVAGPKKSGEFKKSTTPKKSAEPKKSRPAPKE